MARSVVLQALLALLFMNSAVMMLNAQFGANSTIPTVNFTRNNWATNPPYVSITVGSMGNVVYHSTPNSVQQTGEPYSVEFQSSGTTQSKIFQLTEKLDFFRGKLDVSNSSATNKPTNSLTFTQGVQQSGVTYTSSADPLIQQLTTLFENMSATIEAGRELSDKHRRQDGAGMAAEIAAVEQMVASGRVTEPQASLVPALQAIASDSASPAETRQNAGVLLKTISNASNAQ